jgi:hypothetical protein
MANFPVINMIYDFAPLKMQITKQERDLSRFLVNVSLLEFNLAADCNRGWNIRDIRVSQQIRQQVCSHYQE